MASRSFAVVLAFALLTGVAAEAKAKRAPVVPMDVIYATGDMILDVYAHAYSAIEGVSTKHGIHTQGKDLLTKVLTNDPIGLACSKVGCKAKDINDAISKAQSTVLQVKAQAYEHAAKGFNALDNVAVQVVTQIETHVPSYKGVVPKTFGNLVIFALYSVFVLYITLKILRFVIGTSLGIFCCVCCCGCCRGKAAPKKGKNSGKKAAPDAKAASPTNKAAKAKAGKK